MKTGYDIGGAEWPLSPEELTVVDILRPDDEHGADWVKRDLNDSNWTDGLQARPMLYLGRVLRYIDKERLRPLAAELASICTSGGQIVIFDHMDVIEPIVAHFAEVSEIDLINPRDNDQPADWRVVIKVGEVAQEA